MAGHRWSPSMVEENDEQTKLGRRMLEEKQALVQVYMRVPHNHDSYSFVAVEPWSEREDERS